jgi:glycosyltransferase involved in cell wall biosynthesis
MKKNKMILFSYSSIPSYTANSIAVMNFCNSLNKECKLTVVCIKNKEIKTSYQEFYRVNDLNLILLPRFFLKFNYIFYKIFAIVLCLIKRNSFVFSRDIVISYILTKCGIKNIFEIHQIEQNGNNYYTKNFKKFLNNIKDNKNLIKVVAISESLKRECINFGIEENKIAVENSGVRKDFFKNKINNNNNILYLGSLQRGKGIENIIELSKKMKDNKFFIIGGKREELKDLPKNIVHKQWIMPSKILTNVKNMDYALMLFDNQKYKFYSPLKLFEYMAMGKIIIATNIDGINDIIVDDYNGVLIEPKNLNEIPDIINKLEKNKKLKEYISKNAKQTAQKYLWDERAKRIIKLYK